MQKLTHKQQQRIANNFQKKLKPNQIEQNLTQGKVVTKLANSFDIATNLETITCKARSNLNVAIGDEVLINQAKQVIEAVLPRKSELTKPDFYKGLKVVAANIDLIVIVNSAISFSSNILDRYLIACENAQIPVLIVINKIDLLSKDEFINLENILQSYQNLGYTTLKISTYQAYNLKALADYLQNKTAILVGQSGVGKSSIINNLMQKQVAKVGKISEISKLGKHTTSNSELFTLANQGQIIDSPGIREFGLWHLNYEQIIKGFIEFKQFLPNCKFRNCKHQLDDNSCGLVNAVAQGQIAPHRLVNFHKLLESQNNIKTKRYQKF